MRRDGSDFVMAYDSLNDAEHAARCIAEHHGDTLNPYRCDRCDKLHLAPPSRQHSSRHRCVTCDKVSFGSMDEAERAADHQRARYGSYRRAYYSDRCGSYHLTSR